VLHAPHLVDVVVLSAVRGILRAGKVSTRGAAKAMQDLLRLPVRRHAHLPLLPRGWSLRENLTAYDATYVALAEILGLPLLTTDARLAGCSRLRFVVELLRA
jgi:predicted nucleic acid-binding protein